MIYYCRTNYPQISWIKTTMTFSHDFVGWLGSVGVILPLCMTLAETVIILGHSWAGTSKVAHSRVWCLGRGFLEGQLSWDSWVCFSLSGSPQGLSPSGLSAISPAGYPNFLTCWPKAPQKHRSASCQGFLRFRAIAGTSATFCWLKQDRRSTQIWYGRGPHKDMNLGRCGSLGTIFNI